jgi:hypothetical protein
VPPLASLLSSRLLPLHPSFSPFWKRINTYVCVAAAAAAAETVALQVRHAGKGRLEGRNACTI